MLKSNAVKRDSGCRDQLLRAKNTRDSRMLHVS